MKTKNVNCLGTLLVVFLLCFWGKTYGVDAYYYAKVTAKPNITGAGLVYVASSTNTNPAENLYTNESINSQGPSGNKDDKTFDFYVSAKPVREYKFTQWSFSGGRSGNVTSSTTQTNFKYQTKGNQNNQIAGFGTEPTYQEVTATATFEALTPFEVVYSEAVAPYTVTYTYSKLISDIQMETKVWESYSVYAENTPVSTYKGDKVTLSTSVKDGFQGWFKYAGSTETSVSSATEYTKEVTPEAAANYYPKWAASSGNVASVNGTPYTSLEAAIEAANGMTGDVTVQLLQYVFYSGNTALDLTHSMTIDLNGKNLYGLAGCLFRVTNDATVTLRDGATTKGKITVLDANAGQMQAVDVYQGSLINNGASILVENKLAETDFTASTLSCAVYVQADGTFSNNSGTLTSNSVANAYGVYSQGATTIAGGTIAVTTTGNKAYGIYATDGTVAIGGGTITASAAMSACGVVTDGNAQGGAASVTITTTTVTARASVQNAAAVRVIDGTITVNGGTFTVNNTPTGAYGAASGAETIVKRKGYPNNGQLVINGGTFTTTANTTSGTGFAIFVNPSITLPGTDGYVSTTITGGKFKTTGKVKGVTNSTAAGIQISGGMYNVAIQALNHIKVGFYAKTMASGDTGYSDGYRYQVIEGENTQAVCRIVEVDGLEFTTLEAALGYVSNHPEAASLRILMLKPYYMSQPGIYTLPSNAGLLLPYRDGQTDYYDVASNYETTYEDPSMYMQLTLGGSVQLNVSGKIEIGGRQYVAGQGSAGAGVPTGAYGQLHLEPGCKITLLNGAILNAWGYVTGKGEIDARKGSEVYEQFQMMDWKGGTISSLMLSNSEEVFPVNQYFIQNVEAPTTFHPGSGLFAITGVRVSALGATLTPRAKVQIIGKDAEVAADRDVAMFLMNPADDQDNTWVRKSYDAEHDRQVYEVNSAASLGSMIINIENYVMNSQDYILPVTNNMKIHLLSGNMGITQSTVLLPGAEIEIDKTATVAINSGEALYLYDIKQWDKFVYSNVYAHRLKYSPAFNGAPSDVQRKIVNANGSSALSSATINVHGTFDVQGSLFTTTDGANIYSTVADAGTVKFSVNAVASGSVYQPHKSYKVAYSSALGKEVATGLENEYVSASCTSAKLKNEDGSYQPTVGTTSGKSFCFIDMNDGLGGRWTSLRTEGCFVLDEATGIYYAKPADYVALKNGTTQNADHTYSSATGNRLFILMNDEDEGCQWWEVVYHEASGLYYCDKNDKYYFFDEDIDEWVVKMYTVSWYDWDGTPLTDENNEEITYFLPYGTMPVFNSSKPVTRPKETYYTYDFAGWEPELAPVTGDASYTAKYDRKDVMFTITFNWTENEVAKTHKDFLTANTMPTPPDVDMTGKEWSPALAYVTGDTTYTLQDKDPGKTNYTVTYKNKGGAILKKANGTDDAIYLSGTIDGNGDATRPDYDGATPALNPADIPEDMNMVWDTENPWLPALTDKISQDMIYVAQYKSTPKTYTITWNWMDDVDAEHSTVRTTENVAYMAVPQYTYETPTKPSDEENNYVFSGWNVEPVAATEDATYTAVYTTVPKDQVIDDEEEMDYGVQKTVTNLTITATGQLTIPSTSRVNATNLYLEATSDASGQLITNANTSINITGSAYFDWTMNGTTGTVRRTWYAVAVPWEVDARTGITDKATGRTLTAGRDFDLIYYNGATRASEGNVASCWEYVQWDIQGHDRQGNPRPVDNLLHPGRLYMMYFAAEGLQTVRFEKAAGADVMYMSPLNVSEYSAATGDDKDGGWNGIANPRTYFASLSAGSATYAQVLNNGNLDDYFAGESSPVYQTIDLGASKFMVGKPIFLQATGDDPVVVTKQTTAGIVNAAPRRKAAAQNAPEGIDAVYQLTIAAEGKPSSDNLFVQVAEDEKADKYVIGKDLSKGGVAAKRAQMWVDRYNTKLSVNTQMLVNDEATYPLVLFAPAAGEYTISTVQSTMSNEDYDLYLTLNGEAIWNLSNGDYTLSLPQGNTADYGLRISAKKGPQVATGIDEAIVNANGEIQKVLINDKVFIIRGNKVYTIDGKMVK